MSFFREKAILLAFHLIIYSLIYLFSQSFIKHSLGAGLCNRLTLKFLLTTHHVFSVCKILSLNCRSFKDQCQRTECKKDKVCLLFSPPVVVTDCQKIVLSTLHSLNKKHIFSQCPLYIFPLGKHTVINYMEMR